MESSDYSSDSESFTSESSDESPLFDLSLENQSGEDEKQSGGQECITISSDEESMELELPATPSAPLTPGAQLELCVQGWSGQEAGVNQQGTHELDNVIELHDVNMSQETLLLLTSSGLPGLCLTHTKHDCQSMLANNFRYFLTYLLFFPLCCPTQCSFRFSFLVFAFWRQV